LTQYYTDDQWVDWIDSLADRDFICIDNFLPENVLSSVKRMLKEQLAQDEFTQAGIGSVFNNVLESSIRSDQTYWLDRNRDIQLSEYFEVVEELISKLNRYCYLSLSGFEFHLAHYPQGSFYKRHLDSFSDRSNRMISMIIYMNENWQKGDGGELVIYKGEEEIKIAPLQNRCVLFKSQELEHEVLLAHKDRFSVTGWLLYQPSGVGYILG
jgi:SM-20-related protein